jgi:hypothetical protein
MRTVGDLCKEGNKKEEIEKKITSKTRDPIYVRLGVERKRYKIVDKQAKQSKASSLSHRAQQSEIMHCTEGEY